MPDPRYPFYCTVCEDEAGGCYAVVLIGPCDDMDDAEDVAEAAMACLDLNPEKRTIQ